MALSRGELVGKVLRLLNKTAGYQGFFDADKVNDALEDCMDFIATECFLAGEGWFNRITYLSNVSGQVSVDLPQGLALIGEVRYLVGNRYIPLMYDDATLAAQFATAAGMNQFPSRYRVVEGKLYFNPPPAEGGTNYIMVEHTTYPTRIMSDSQEIDPQFDMAMMHYAKWRAASQLAASIGKYQREWERYEDEWFGRMQLIINKKFKSPIYVREFGGG